MRRSLRVVLATLGLAAVLYGAASLTGGWLGDPPWWQDWESVHVDGNSALVASQPSRLHASGHFREVLKPRGDRAVFSSALVVLGLLIVGAALQPRWPWTAIGAMAIGVACVGVGVASRVGWPWRYHLRPMENDAERDSMRDPWTMTPAWPSFLFLILGLLIIWSAVRALRRRSGGVRVLVGAVVCAVGLSLVATMSWLLAWNGV